MASEQSEEIRPEPLLLSTHEAAYRLSIGRTKMLELIKSGTIPSVRIGTRVLVAPEELERFVAKLRSER